MRALAITLLLATQISPAFADSGTSMPPPEWQACASDSDCTVIHVNGCPWDSIPVARRYSEEVRAWAQRENMRHNCAREAVSNDLKQKMRALCKNKRCVFASLAIGNK
jgi:hypothetical protein